MQPVTITTLEGSRLVGRRKALWPWGADDLSQVPTWVGTWVTLGRPPSLAVS